MAWIQERKFKKGKRWYICTRIAGKVKLVGKASTKDLAIKIRNQAEDKLESRRLGFVDENISTAQLIEKYIKDCPALGKSKRTVELAEYSLNKLKHLYGRERIIALNTQHLERFKLDLLSTKAKNKEKNYSINMVKIVLRNVKTFFQYCIRNGYLHSNPCRGIDNLKSVPVARFLNRKEITELKKACKFNPELWKICKVALYTGMRQGEILHLKSDQIHNKNRSKWVYIRKELTKNRKDKIVPIHEAIESILNKKGRIFEGWSAYRLKTAFRRAVRRTKLASFRFHDLKHTFCSTYLQSGGTIADLSEITGNTLSSLKVYVHFQPSYLDQRIKAVTYGNLR